MDARLPTIPTSPVIVAAPKTSSPTPASPLNTPNAPASDKPTDFASTLSAAGNPTGRRAPKPAAAEASTRGTSMPPSGNPPPTLPQADTLLATLGGLAATMSAASAAAAGIAGAGDARDSPGAAGAAAAVGATGAAGADRLSSAADAASVSVLSSATGSAQLGGGGAQALAPAELVAQSWATAAGALPDIAGLAANTSAGAALKQLAATNVADAAEPAARSDATSRAESAATETATTPFSTLNAAEAAKPAAADVGAAVMVSQAPSNRGAVTRTATISGSSAAASAQALSGAGGDAAPLDAPSPLPVAPFQLDVSAVLGLQDKHARGANDSLTASASPTAGVDGAAAATGTTAGTGFAAATSVALAAPGVGDAKSAPALNTPEFTQALGERVSYLIDNNLNGATLQVSPPQLGPIELRVTVEAGHAQVWMSAHNPATLDALQNSSAKLREMLSSQGFAQVSVDISQRSFHDGSPYSQNRAWSPPADSTAGASAEVQPTALASSRTADGALDAYA